MGAGIFERAESAAGLPVKNDFFPADGPRKRRVLDLVVPGDGVPEVTKEHGGNPSESPVSQYESAFHIDFEAILSTMFQASSDFSPRQDA